MKGNVKPAEELTFYDQVELVKFLGDTLNVNGGSKAEVTARTRIGRIKFRECVELLNGRKLLLKIIGQIYQLCKVGDVDGSKTWCL